MNAMATNYLPLYRCGVFLYSLHLSFNELHPHTTLMALQNKLNLKRKKKFMTESPFNCSFVEPSIFIIDCNKNKFDLIE